MNQPSRKKLVVWNLLIEPDDCNLDLVEATIEQARLDWINLIIGERHPVELRRIGGEEAARYLMGNPAKRIVAM